ncbi:MAG: lipid-binding SYLF domain-containing protein [Gammaproteobacteria bacterium]|nr:lipid-binding SYLF domain-containing protein [Gammaproteobacteria bacterium]
MTKLQRKSVVQLTAGIAMSVMMMGAVQAQTAADLHQDAQEALALLYKSNEVAASFGDHAKAVLVFPNIVKAGLVFGGAYGEGVLMRDGATPQYYNSFTGSWGLQAGAQSYGYAVFLMTDAALEYLDDSAGWELGVGPTVVVMDEGAAANVSTTSIQDDAYAFIFNQQGLMAGVSVEGSKITRINP